MYVLNMLSSLNKDFIIIIIGMRYRLHRCVSLKMNVPF